MKYEITGIVEDIEETKTFGKGFTKRNIIIDAKEEKSTFPNVICLSATKDNCSLLDDISSGDKVHITFVINGRTWDGPKGRSYFTDLKILSIERIGATKVKPSIAKLSESDCPDNNSMDGMDDMPF